MRSSQYSQISRLIQIALAKGSDLVEVRLDYINAFDSRRFRKALGSKPHKCIFTCRPLGEGGHFKGDEEERFKLLSSLVPLKPAYIDIELNPVSQRRKWADQISYNAKLIVSYHNLQETPSLESLKDISEEASRIGDIAKIVTTAKCLEDNIRILKLYKMFDQGKLVAFCMGRHGILSRVVSPFFGSPFAYASLEGLPTAPGQLPIGVLRDLYDGVREY